MIVPLEGRRAETEDGGQKASADKPNMDPLVTALHQELLTWPESDLMASVFFTKHLQHLPAANRSGAIVYRWLDEATMFECFIQLPQVGSLAGFRARIWLNEATIVLSDMSGRCHLCGLMPLACHCAKLGGCLREVASNIVLLLHTGLGRLPADVSRSIARQMVVMTVLG